MNYASLLEVHRIASDASEGGYDAALCRVVNFLTTLRPTDWVPITKHLLATQADWLYEPMWISDGKTLYKGTYTWEQGHNPDRLITDGGNLPALGGYYARPVVVPELPTKAEEDFK